MSAGAESPRPDKRASILPAGTVTFLVADVAEPAGLGPAAGEPPQLHQAVGPALAAHGGRLSGIDAAGDLVAVFGSATDAVAAALDLRAAVREGTGSQAPGRGLRIALHTGEASVRDDGGYLGAAVRTGRRLVEVANGGQALVSTVTAAAVGDRLPTGSCLVDLGLHRLRDLSPPARVFELRDGDRAAEPGALRSLDRVPHNLPIHLTGFVGRLAELTAVHELLLGGRLVTLTGVGGWGKTRLAAQAAADLAEQWPDGVWWVELGMVTDAAEVAEVVASAVGCSSSPFGARSGR